MKFTIYRGSWRRGGDTALRAETFGDTYLLNDRNMMCCLGQCAIQSGVPLKSLMEEPEPCNVGGFEESLENSGLLMSEDGQFSNSRFSNKAIPINDDESMSDSEREIQLISLAKIHGHELEFVDGIAPWFEVTA